MINSGVKILYGNFAPEAKENFEISTNDTEFDTLKQFQQYNLNFPNYGNPCEFYQTALDGGATPIPTNTEKLTIGLWSKQLSNDSRLFETPIVLEMTSPGKYSSQALNFVFDTDNNIFCDYLNIKWYGDDELLQDVNFYPDSAEYLCKNQVEYYNKIIVTFYSLNIKQNRLRLRSIEHGYGTLFEAKNLRSLNIIQEINPISTEITINTADFDLDLPSEQNVLFQRKQPLSIYFNDELKATTFVKSYTRKSKNLWSLQTEDYIGLLDESYFYGGVYDNENAVKLLKEIFTIAQIPFKIDARLNDSVVSGYIPYTTCREAIMQVAFAIQAVVDTSNSDVVNVFAISDAITQTIPLKRIMQGQKFDEQKKFTSLEVVAHKYIPIDEDVIVYNSDVEQKNVFIKFSQPLHDLSIEKGEILSSENDLSSGKNYALINAESGCVLKGKKYEHRTITKTKRNKFALANEIEKVISIEKATLVSENNVDNIIEKCYNYFSNTTVIKMKIVEGKHVSGGEYITYGKAKYGSFKYGGKFPQEISYDAVVNVGDLIEAETEFLGNQKGRIIKQTFNLNSGMVIKDVIVR